MSKKMTSLLMVLCLIMINVGCASSKKDYEPKSPDEEAIISLLKELQGTWNNRDIKGWLALWHEDGKIMYGQERNIATKKEYEKLIPERMSVHPTSKYGKPKINVSGNEAIAKTSMLIRGSSFPITFNLIKQNNQWLLMSWKY